MLAHLSSGGGTNSIEQKKEKVDPNKKPALRTGTKPGRDVKTLNKTVATDKNKPGIKT